MLKASVWMSSSVPVTTLSLPLTLFLTLSKKYSGACTCACIHKYTYTYTYSYLYTHAHAYKNIHTHTHIHIHIHMRVYVHRLAVTQREGFRIRHDMACCLFLAPTTHPAWHRVLSLSHSHATSLLPLSLSRTDPVRQTCGDTKEGFYIGRDIGSTHELADLPLHGPNVWPDDASLPFWRENMEKYHASMERVVICVCVCVCAHVRECVCARYFTPKRPAWHMFTTCNLPLTTTFFLG